MSLLEFFYGILVLIALVITVIGVVGLRYNYIDKDEEIQKLKTQITQLRKRNMAKVNKEREEKAKLKRANKSKGGTK